VLTNDQLDELASYLEAIHIHFNEVDPEAGNVPMDVEWKLLTGGHPVIKQARPLRVRSTL
jgi:phosphoenolpyruvate synthase/pyruvate phosphate dikinase